ncbi:MAG: PQQ-binding-like beta-propeller repeat protein, partial [Planctomycetaceae bacterium]|nr:PQQ-binding-like beta-propeller repeat protein [Planctomycetaceae bacterium]
NSHAAAHRLLDSLPADKVRQYEEQLGDVARAKFRAAQQTTDLEALRKIADQYRMTKAGYDALRFLALWQFDHGEYLNSAAGFQALSEHPLSKKTNSPYSGDMARWIIALSRAGLTEEAERLAKQHKFEKLTQRLVPKTNAGLERSALENRPSTKTLWKRPFPLPGPVDKHLHAIRKDLEARGLLPVPSQTPLVLGNRVIARNFEEIVACDRNTGAVQWRKPFESQVVQSAQNEGLMANPGFRRMLTRQLATAAFADRNAGTLTSDGSRVFVVLNDHTHDHFLNIPGWNLNQSQVDYWSNWGFSCCQLMALDAETGKELWRRPAELPHRDPAQPKFSGRIRDPLPEVFFFGPPTPLGHSLYVIGQKEREIRLFVLSPETGETQWSLPLVTTELPLVKDRARRRLAFPVVFHGGLLLCPTGAGALAAVDLSSRSCRWIFRYPRNDIPKLSPGTFPADSQNTHASLDRWWTGWRDVGLIVENETVLLASPESSHLHAVSLKTGETQWTLPREEGLFLSRGIGGQVLLIGSQSLRMIASKTGQQITSLAIPTPAGRGWGTSSKTGESYLLPL